MYIGGIQKHSFIDYPGKVSCVVFLAGCNFDCPYCHNPQLTGEPGSRPERVALGDVLRFLEERRGFLDGVVISGGEPTLHPDLPDLCLQVKSLGYPVKLDTNGSRPHMLGRLIRARLVDYLAMDIKTDPQRYEGCITSGLDCSALLASLQLIMESGLDYEFRTTCVKPLVTPGAIEGIARLIQGCRRYALQPFRENVILHPEFFNGNDPACSFEEMSQLKRIAEPWVQTCMVR
ncbi:MAG: anaerobic ribonucleoside-triphosphate reductase activating protein [Hyphomicrobiales bacterium]